MKYRNTGILLDTNLFLLYLVGLYDKHLISEFKRTNTFSDNDFITLMKVIQNFKNIYTTQSILAEVSNLSYALNKRDNYHLFKRFAKVIVNLEEKNIPSRDIVNDEMFITYGLTDTAIKLVSDSHILVMTDDFNLYNYLLRKKIDVINFNHIRGQSYLFA